MCKEEGSVEAWLCRWMVVWVFWTQIKNWLSTNTSAEVRLECKGLFSRNGILHKFWKFNQVWGIYNFNFKKRKHSSFYESMEKMKR